MVKRHFADMRHRGLNLSVGLILTGFMVQSVQYWVKLQDVNVAS